MNFAFSEEQDEFREMLRRFCEEKTQTTELRRLLETAEGYDPSVWTQMGAELGLQGVAVPEAYGGQGFGALELGIVMEEMGRTLFPAPYLGSCVMAANAILNAGSDPEKKALLPTLASGEEIWSFAQVEDGADWRSESVRLEVQPADGRFRLSGAKSLVVDGHVADRLVVVVRQPGTEGAAGLSFVTLGTDDDGVRVEPTETMDPLRRYATVHFDGALAQALGEPGTAAPALRKTLAQTAVALSAEMVGVAEHALHLAVEYAKSRMQFARPIGSFQAIKHKAADVLLEIELAKSAAYYALWAADEDNEDLFEAAHLAKAFCGDTAMQATTECIQIHGGMGFTWEHDAHLYYKRAMGSELLLGDASAHRAALATELGF